jgi:photosystem II stability/assembly factor-like uncharacterized protein
MDADAFFVFRMLIALQARSVLMRKSFLMLLTGIISFSTNQLMAQWLQTNGPRGGEAFCLSSIDTLLFAGTEDGVYRSGDDGANWEQAGPKTIVRALSVESAGASGFHLFAGTFNDGVYLSTDPGDTWAQVNFGLLNRSVHCLAANDSTLFAGTDTSGVFISTDGGANWRQISIPDMRCLSLQELRRDLDRSQ